MSGDGAARDSVRDALLKAGISPHRWQEARGSGLGASERRLSLWLLTEYSSRGTPSSATLQEQAEKLGLDVRDALRTIADHDLLTLDASGHVQHVYPFSAAPTAHRVWLGDAVEPVYAMCAIDALGTPFMLGQAATVVSRDPSCGDEVRVVVDNNGRLEWRPDTAVVVVGTARGKGCVAETCCPVINFFVSEASENRNLRHHQEVNGRFLTMLQATEAGRIIFGDVLRD